VQRGRTLKNKGWPARVTRVRAMRLAALGRGEGYCTFPPGNRQKLRTFNRGQQCVPRKFD